MTPPIILNPGTDLPFPTSLPEFMRLFPDDAALRALRALTEARDGHG